MPEQITSTNLLPKLRHAVHEAPGMRATIEETLKHVIFTGGGAEDPTFFTPKTPMKLGNHEVKDAAISAPDASPAGDEPKVTPLLKREKNNIATYHTLPYDKGGAIPLTSVSALQFEFADGQKYIKPIADFTVTPPALEGQETPTNVSRDAALHGDTGEESATAAADAAAALPPAEPPRTENAAANPPTPPTPEPAPAAPPPALTELQERAQPRKPEAISVIGLDVKQKVALRAAKIVEEINATSKGILTKIWKGNIASELILEHQRQYVDKLKTEAHLMFSDETFKVIRQKAKERYDNEVGNKKGFRAGWTKLTDWVKSYTGGYTSQEYFALGEVKKMYESGDLARIDSFEKSAQAIQQRFETKFIDSEGAIRANFGEAVRTVKAGTREHTRMMKDLTGIRNDYLNGTIDDNELGNRIDAFGIAHIGGKSDLYTSSLSTLIKNDKALLTDTVDRTVMDAQFAKMDIRIGLAQMGESTQFEKSATQKTVDWITSHHWLGASVGNEAFLGTSVSIGLTCLILPRYVASRGARVAFGAVGGGAFAGAFAGFKEKWRRKNEYWAYMLERETGGGLPKPGDKLRQWAHDREVPQTEVSDLMKRMTEHAYANGMFRKDMSEADLNKTLAALADAKARRILSAREKDNISLIRWGPAVDVARTDLDLSINKLETDLLEHYKKEKRFNGHTITQWTKLLTDAQSSVILDGQQELNSLSDPLKTVLGEVSDKAPAVKIYRRKLLGIYGKEEERGSAEGLNAAMREINTAIRLEAVHRGVNTALIGGAIGTAISEGLHIGLQGYEYGVQNAPIVNGYINDILHGTVQHVQHHIIEVPGITPVSDAQGISHVLQAQIPDNTQLIADPAHHAFNLAYTNGSTIMHGIHIDATGKILDTDTLNRSPEALFNGLHFDNADHLLTTAGHAGGEVTGGGFDISAGEMAKLGGANHGEWGWMSHNMSVAGIEHVDPATNATTKLFHFYETNIKQNSNVDIAPIPGVHRVVHYLTDGEGHQTINYNSMPDNMWFHDLPNQFRPENQALIGQHMDHAMKLYEQVFGTTKMSGPGYPGWEAALKQIEASDDPERHLSALLLKIGPMDRPPTEADYNELMHLLAGPSTPPTELLTHTGIIEQNVGIGLPLLPLPVIDLFPTPAFIPLPRDGMLPGTEPPAPTPTPTPIEETPSRPSKKKIVRENLKESTSRNVQQEIPNRRREVVEPRLVGTPTPTERTGTNYDEFEEPELKIDDDILKDINKFVDVLEQSVNTKPKEPDFVINQSDIDTARAAHPDMVIDLSVPDYMKDFNPNLPQQERYAQLDRLMKAEGVITDQEKAAWLMRHNKTAAQETFIQHERELLHLIGKDDWEKPGWDKKWLTNNEMLAIADRYNLPMAFMIRNAHAFVLTKPPEQIGDSYKVSYYDPFLDGEQSINISPTAPYKAEDLVYISGAASPGGAKSYKSLGDAARDLNTTHYDLTLPAVPPDKEWMVRAKTGLTQTDGYNCTLWSIFHAAVAESMQPGDNPFKNYGHEQFAQDTGLYLITYEDVVGRGPEIKDGGRATSNIFTLLDTNAGSIEISPKEAPRYIPAILSQLEKPLYVQPGELKVAITHNNNAWQIKGTTDDPAQALHLTLSPDPDNGFAAELKLTKFPPMTKLLEMGVNNPSLILGVLNGKLQNSQITKLTILKDGRMVFEGIKK